MKICDEVSNEEGKEVILDGNTDEVFLLMLNGKSVMDTIKTSRGDFKVKYPKQKGLIIIGRLAAIMRGGVSATAIDASAEYEIQKCAVLDVIVTGGPTWFEDAKKNPNFSWMNMPDSHFADEVYAKVLAFCAVVHEKLKRIKEHELTETTE